jgi:hypothetical protein
MNSSIQPIILAVIVMGLGIAGLFFPHDVRSAALRLTRGKGLPSSLGFLARKAQAFGSAGSSGY